MEGKAPPNDYVRWRLSQGYDLDQTKFMFSSFDNKRNKIDEIQSWLKSNEKPHSDFWYKSNKIILSAQKSIHERNDLFSKKLMPRIQLTLPRIQSATQQAMYGKYQDAMILLRSAIEGFLRFTLDLIYEFRFKLHDVLENLDNEGWKDARKIEEALAISPMCRWLARMGIVGAPLFTKKYNLYRYLEIDELNNYTHSNILTVLANNDGKFDLDSYLQFVNLHRKTIESFIIIWQNLSDKIDPKESPIVEIGVDFLPDEMPLLAKLIESRSKN